MPLRRRSIVSALLLAASALVTIAAPVPRADAVDPACTVDALLVNSCRPWFGGSSNGYAQVASDTISQSLYFEQRTGRPMDMVHLYHGVGAQANVLNASDLYFARRPDTLLYLNWPLTNTFALGTGGDATTNGYIDQMARSIKSLGDTKILLTLHHEPENDIAFTCPGQSTKPGTMGTAAEYVAMWRNVRARFDALGVSNVIWVMNYMNYKPYDCMVDDLWPGNDLVDYVSFNGYHSTDVNVSFEYEVGRFYDFLLANSDAGARLRLQAVGHRRVGHPQLDPGQHLPLLPAGQAGGRGERLPEAAVLHDLRQRRPQPEHLGLPGRLQPGPGARPPGAGRVQHVRQLLARSTATATAGPDPTDDTTPPSAPGNVAADWYGGQPQCSPGTPRPTTPA